MKLYPAIDLRGGQAVRLYQSDYDQMTVYNADPVAQAKSNWQLPEPSTARSLTLDGAKDDTRQHADYRRHAKQGGKDRGRRRHPGRKERIKRYLVEAAAFGHHRCEKLCLYRRDGAEVQALVPGRRHEKRPGSREWLEGSYPRTGRGFCRLLRVGVKLSSPLIFPGRHDAGTNMDLYRER